MEKSRILCLDYARAICIILVIFMHSYETYFYIPWEDMGVGLKIFHSFIYMLCRISIPTFFYITGSLTLKKNSKIKKI